MPPPNSDRSSRRSSKHTSSKHVAQLAEAQQNSQMSSTSQSRLKRRVPQESLAASSPQSRPGNTFTSDDFDLPLPETHQPPPVKRARPDNGPQESKKTTKKKDQLAIAEKKQQEREKDNSNTAISSKLQNETTVASTRSRRATKTPVYVQDLGDSDQEHADDDDRDGEENPRNSEAVEDSHKLSNSAVEAAFEASELSFHQNLQDLLMAADNTPNETSHGLLTAVDNIGNEPSRGLQNAGVRETSIPYVNENALRKTRIVHFGTGGPDNQAVSPKTPYGPTNTSVSDVAVDAGSEPSPPAQPPIILESVPMPPPARRCLPLPRPRRQEFAPAFTVTEPQREEQSPLEEQNEKLESVFATGPVRIKKSFSHTIIPRQQTEPEHPPATPASFRTRLETEKRHLHGVEATPDETRASADRDHTHLSGNASITIVDENATVNRQRPFFRSRSMRQRRSVSTDLESLEDSPSLRIQSKDMVDDHKNRFTGIRESQQGLMDSILKITNDVMFRFGEEEDAIKAKANEYHAGGNAVLHTLTDSWNDRLSHHHLKLRKELEEEKEVLARASKTVNEAKMNDLEILQNGNATLEKIDKNTDTLMARIAALRCKD